MANTSSRTLRLLSLLQTHRHWPGAELAERLGVSLRTLRRDIDRLRELGYPVQAQRGVDGGYQVVAGADLPPLVLDDEEAVALAVGLLGAARSPVEGAGEASVRALGKVIQVMPGRLRRQVETLGAMTETGALSPPRDRVDVAVLTTVAQACRDFERLHFAYVAAGGARSERRAEPHRLVSLGTHWYLVAYDLDRRDWRSFRLDRLREPRTPGGRFEPRPLPGADAAAFVRAGIARAPRALEVAATVSAPAAEVRRRIGRWASVEEVTTAACRVEISAESTDWAAIALAATEADFVVERPAEMVDHLRRWVDRFERAVGGGPISCALCHPERPTAAQLTRDGGD